MHTKTHTHTHTHTHTRGTDSLSVVAVSRDAAGRALVLGFLPLLVLGRDRVEGVW